MADINGRGEGVNLGPPEGSVLQGSPEIEVKWEGRPLQTVCYRDGGEAIGVIMANGREN